MKYQQAYKEKRRAFYNDYSDTIRSCPENYCLAVKNELNINRWIPYDDGACKLYYSKIQELIDKHGEFVDDDEMAKIITKCLPKKHGYSSWQKLPRKQKG